MYGVTRDGIRKQNKKERKKKKTLGVKFSRTYLLACLHNEINSFRLFKEGKSSLQMIKYFSQRHRLHLLEVGLDEAVCCKILHLTLNFVKFSFKYQVYLPSSVLWHLFAFENEDL